jgi:hypothetical protein
MTVATPRADLHSAPERRRPYDQELIIKEARRRRRRRWLVAGLVLVVIAVAALVVGEIVGAQGKTGTSPRSNDRTKRSAPLTKEANAGSIAFSRGAAPTPIYFLNSQEGWIAIGCGNFCYQYRPAILRTTNGGRTWRVITGPDIGSVSFSGPTWMALGGRTEVRFLDARRGFYTQAGELWTTDDGGATWSLVNTPGPVVSFATLGNSASALVSHCPLFPLSCSQVEWYRWSMTTPEWVRSPRSFSTGGGDPTDAALTAAGSSLFLSVPGHQYQIDSSGQITPVSTACWVIQGPPTGGQLVGICPVDTGGIASKVKFAVSTDRGTTWTPTVEGPPTLSQYNWSGAVTTNGRGTIWYVVGGGALWRGSTYQRKWAPIYSTRAGSDEELYPVVFASPLVGFMGESGNESVQLLKTSDAGLIWASITAALPKGSSVEPPSGRLVG